MQNQVGTVSFFDRWADRPKEGPELGKDSMAGVSDLESWCQDSHPSAVCPAIWQGWVGFSDRRETCPQHSRQEEDLRPTSTPTHHSVGGNDTEANWHLTRRKGLVKGCLAVASVAHHCRVQLLGWRVWKFPCGVDRPWRPLLSAAPGSRDQVGHQEAPRVLPGLKSEGRNHIRRMWSCLLSMESQRARASQPRIPQEGGPGFMKPAYAGVGPAASSGVGQDFGSLALGCKAGGLAGAAWTGACARGVCALQGLDWAACARRPLSQKGSAGRPVACDSYSVGRAAAQTLVSSNFVLKALCLESA